MDWKEWIQLEVVCTASSLDYAFALDAGIRDVPVMWWGVALCVSVARLISAVTTVDLAIRQRVHSIGFKKEAKELAGPGKYPYARCALVTTLACTFRPSGNRIGPSGVPSSRVGRGPAAGCHVVFRGTTQRCKRHRKQSSSLRARSLAGTHALDLARLLDIPQLEEIDFPRTVFVDLNSQVAHFILKIAYVSVYAPDPVIIIGLLFNFAAAGDLTRRHFVRAPASGSLNRGDAWPRRGGRGDAAATTWIVRARGAAAATT